MTKKGAARPANEAQDADEYSFIGARRFRHRL
jgi:hypothetical protein